MGSTSNDDLSRLLEFLIIVANEMQDAAKRTALYQMMLRDYVDKWSGENTTALLSKTENFIGFVLVPFVAFFFYYYRCLLI